MEGTRIRQANHCEAMPMTRITAKPNMGLNCTVSCISFGIWLEQVDLNDVEQSNESGIAPERIRPDSRYEFKNLKHAKGRLGFSCRSIRS
ncbi:MAG: hypothetical protein AMXMBFR84_43810 [Candidatus Hydrogenedentota bacterium]